MAEKDEKKYLDEEDVLEEQEKENETEEPTEEEPVKEESEEEVEEEKTDSEEEEPTEVESEEKPLDWQEEAKKQGWVPDHVREKHAREAQTLRDQVRNLQTILQSASQPEEEVDENEVVRHGDLQQHIKNLEANIANIQDPAVISEILIRQKVSDYDEVVTSYLEPFSEDKPWLADILRGEPNPAQAAYDLAVALRDKKLFSLGFKDGKPTVIYEEEGKPAPKKRDPKRPPVEALEQSQKQPKTLDEVPTASDAEATEMSVEEFWKLPSDTLMRLRVDKPELYQKMQSKFHEKYG